MEYGSKMAVPLYVYKVICSKLCPRLSQAFVVQGFIQFFLVGVGKMMHVEPRLLGGVWGCAPPEKLHAPRLLLGFQKVEISY